MAKNNRITSRRDHSLKYIENHLRRKADRQRPQRTHPLDEPLGPHRGEGFNPTPSTTVVNTPMTSKVNVLQTGWYYQGDNDSNLGAFRVGAGKDGGDVIRIQGDTQGLHKTNTANMFVHDRGHFSVWVKGFNGGVASPTDEYVMSIHQLNSDATPVDEESLVILWDKSEEELRMYPDISNFPDDYVMIDLPEATWQDEDWHEIRASWSYEDQKWDMSWDDTNGSFVSAATPDVIPWPLWDEFTQVEMFTNIDFQNDIFHDAQFLSFSQSVIHELLKHLFRIVTSTNDDLSGLTNDVTGNPETSLSTVVTVEGNLVYIE